MLQRVHGVLHSAARVAVWLGGLALTLCAVMITVDVFCRKLLGISMGGSDEITAYVFSASTTWAFAYCLMHRANIRIDAVYNGLPARIRSAIDIVSLVMLLVFAGVLAERAAFTLSQSIANQSTSITPLGTRMWIPQSFWVAGWVFFIVAIAFVLLRVLLAAARGDVDQISKLAGLRSTEDEIREETKGTGAATRQAAGDAS